MSNVGDRPLPQPHRCNDRVEDVIQALFEGFGDYSNTLVPAWRLMVKCFKSEEGQEPMDPLMFVTPDNPAYRGDKPLRKQQKKEDVWSDGFVPEETSEQGTKWK